MDLSPADGHALAIRLIRERDHGGFGIYGYDIFLPNLASEYLSKRRADRRSPPSNEVAALMEHMYPAAWELCRRGILRPGVNRYTAQATDDGSGGSGFSFTPFGKEWLNATNLEDFIRTEPERFAQMLAPYQETFGAAFHERGQEAMRCYSGLAFLGCCVMCGAAAETILLAAGEKKRGRDEVMTLYRGATGRSRVENALFGQSRLRDEARPYLGLLSYWRTDAAHGLASGIKENEAYTSLLTLLRFAIFVTDHWAELTETPTSGRPVQAL